MVEEVAVDDTSRQQSLPFRMADIAPAIAVPDRLPMAGHLERMVTEFTFQLRLLRHEWEQGHYLLIAYGMLAFVLGSVSPELTDGGDATLTGMEGILAIHGFHFFQILISILLWGWFLYQAVLAFPIMRVHTVSLVIMWNLVMLAQVFFHQNNPTFPAGIALAEMMGGTLVLLIAGFFLYFFWKAVVETRDLHVEVHHLHEDVRVMEAEMAEHSLMAWTVSFLTWLGLVTVSSWAGVHHVSTYGEQPIWSLVLHLVTGLASIPVLLLLLWYPQRMLGNQGRIQTKAARHADMEMNQVTVPMTRQASCPDCGAASSVRRNDAGALTHPCGTPGCKERAVVGTTCTGCNEPAPPRISCPSCGINAPALDYLPDQEAW